VSKIFCNIKFWFQSMNLILLNLNLTHIDGFVVKVTTYVKWNINRHYVNIKCLVTKQKYLNL